MSTVPPTGDVDPLPEAPTRPGQSFDDPIGPEEPDATPADAPANTTQEA